MNDKFCVLEIIMIAKKKCAILFDELKVSLMPEAIFEFRVSDTRRLCAYPNVFREVQKVS